jgi:hypothetical protein
MMPAILVSPGAPPAATVAPVSSTRWRAAATCAALLLILITRRPEMFTRPQLWAEDGAIFFVGADVDGARAIITPYAGYYHLLPRLLAAAIAPAPAAWIPALYSAASITVVLLLAAAFFSPRIPLPWKPALALSFGVVPHQGEAIGILTNVQWVSSLGLVWLLLADDAATRRQRVSDALAAIGLGLTGVFSAILAPLFLVRAVHRRTLTSVVVAAGVGVAGAVQAWSLLHTPPIDHRGAPLSTSIALEIFGLRLPGFLLLPPYLAARLPLTLWLVVGAAAALGLIVTALLPGRDWWPRMALAGSALFLTAAAMYRFHSGNYTALFAASRLADRYFYLPHLACLWLLCLAGARAVRLRWLAIGAVLAVMAAAGAAWRYDRFVDYGWENYAWRVDAGQRTRIPINPPGFTFTHPGRRR